MGGRDGTWFDVYLLFFFFWYLISRLSSYGQYVIMLSTMFVTLVKVCMSTRKAASFSEPLHSLLGMRLLGRKKVVSYYLNYCNLIVSLLCIIITVFSLGFTPLDVVHHGLWNYFPHAD